MMKFSTAAAALALAVSAGAASANDVNKPVTVLGGTAFFGALHTDNLDFHDVFVFPDVSGPVIASLSIVTVGAGQSNIDFLLADLNGAALSFSPNGYLEVGVLGGTLMNGPLILKVNGLSGAAGGTYASYSGTLNIATAVPEPGTVAMLLAGLAAVGFIARRRRG